MELGDGGMTYIFLYITFFTSCSHPFKFYFYPLLANPYFPPNSALAVILFFISQSLCSLSLSFVLSACITTHTCSISLSLSLSPSLFLYLSFLLVYLFQSYCFSQSPSLKCLCLECCAHASIKLKDASHSFHYTFSV